MMVNTLMFYIEYKCTGLAKKSALYNVWWWIHLCEMHTTGVSTGGSQWIFKYKCFRMHLHTTFVFVYFHLCIFICVFVFMYLFCVFFFCIFICVFVFNILRFIFWQKVHIWLSVETAVRKSRSICDSIVIDPLH